MISEKRNARNIGIILLAAGDSSRLGRPKQLLVYNGETLLQHSLQAAAASSASPIIIVLGAGSEQLKAGLEGANVHIIENSDWEEGMASSIRHGVETLVEISPAAEGLILMMCDQPYVTSGVLDRLIETHNTTGKSIVASGYAETYGPPTFFHRSTFPQLLELKGDIGARSVIRQHSAEVEVVPFAEGEIDIDTEGDYEKLSTGNQGGA
jgi:molybdenum cofactor cytidylyltransferase